MNCIDECHPWRIPIGQYSNLTPPADTTGLLPHPRLLARLPSEQSHAKISARLVWNVLVRREVRSGQVQARRSVSFVLPMQPQRAEKLLGSRGRAEQQRIGGRWKARRLVRREKSRSCGGPRAVIAPEEGDYCSKEPSEMEADAPRTRIREDRRPQELGMARWSTRSLTGGADPRIRNPSRPQSTEHVERIDAYAAAARRRPAWKTTQLR